MPSCPKCGFDVSPALRVCGVCRTSLDRAPASPPSGASFGAPMPLEQWFPFAIGVVILWPIVAVIVGIPVGFIFAGFFLGAILLGVLGNSSFATGTKPKTITHPLFGELKTSNWKPDALTVWSGHVDVSGETRAIEIVVVGTGAGPSATQEAFYRKLLPELPQRKAAARTAFEALDQSDWPEVARTARLELVAIELDEDGEIAEGLYSLRFAAAVDPDADYHADFAHDRVEEAYRMA